MRTLTRKWTPRSLRGGEQEGTCTDHPKRQSVWVQQDGKWIDTGLCATDMRAVERADRAIAREMRKGVKP